MKKAAYSAAFSAFASRMAFALRRFRAATTRFAASTARAFFRFFMVRCGILACSHLNRSDYSVISSACQRFTSSKKALNVARNS